MGVTKKVIVLETSRLLLRHYKDADINSLYNIFSDPETMEFYPAPFSMHKTQGWIKQNIERYQIDGFGLWVVCLKDSNEFLGDCGLVKQQINGKLEIEIGYHISKEHWSKGYASEAARACMEHGFYQLGLNKLISIIDPRNIASIRVAEKIGFIQEKEVFIFNKNHYIYSGVKANV
jgi:[ribosomal protein S5]-alanine N-acetyltransferase